MTDFFIRAGSVRAADDIEHCLALFFFHNLERALQSRGELLRIIDHFAVSVVRGNDFLVARRWC